MPTPNRTGPLRRSSRVAMKMPITISSLEPTAQFLEECETLVVSAHGCSLRSPIKLEPGFPLQFRLNDGRETTAHVVDCKPIGTNQAGWRLAAKLDHPDNFWGQKSWPEDWKRFLEMPVASDTPLVSANQVAAPKMPMLRALIAEVVDPLQSELNDLREKLAMQQRRNRFEVSLSQIPPEVEEKLWSRLREELGTQALRETREQAERVLGTAQSAIERKITEAQEEFRQRVGEQMQAFERHGEAVSEQTGDELRQRLQSATEEFKQQASAAGARLHQQGDEFLESLVQRLAEEREAQCRELQAAQAAAAAESSRLQTQLDELGRRVAELDETARHLESGLNTRLTRMATEIVSGARAQLESAADSIFQKLAARNAEGLGHQLEDASARLKNIQKDVEDSVSETVKASASEELQTFRKTIEDSAQRSVARWRLALARDLNAVANMLGEHSRSASETGNNEHQ